MASKISTRGNNVSVTYSFFPNRYTRKKKKTSVYFLLSLRCLLQTYCCLTSSSIKIVSEHQINQKTSWILLMKLPSWLGGKESACQCRRLRFDPWIGKIPWRRKWQPTSVFCWEIPWTEESGGLQSMGLQRVGYDLATKQQSIH